MVAGRPRAAFEPIAPSLDVRELVENNPNFKWVDRVSVDMIDVEGMAQFERLVLAHVIKTGKPLVVDGFENRLDPWLFNPKWLNENMGSKEETARDLSKGENLPLTIGHYLQNLPKLTEQFYENPTNYKDRSRQKVYLKDIDCPQAWEEKLRDHIPSSLFYLNDNAGEVDGAGAVEENVPGVGRRKGKGIAPAGDLMSSLPSEMRAENLMCYIGHEGTYTPAHKEMCASLGQNIMVNTSEAFDEEGQPERPGSSIWFMTESKDRHMVQEYWLSVLGHDIEVENHFAQIAAWQKAPFTVYVIEQRAGDFILIPPLAPHQVWNRGTRTMKVAWNRTTVETLEMAMNEAIPNARMVCRDEQYKNKAIVYYTLLKYSQLLRQARMLSMRSELERQAITVSRKVRQVQKDFKKLFDVFKNIMLSESFAPGSKESLEYVQFDSNVTCSYCRGDIFNRFLTCKTCMDPLGVGIDDAYDVCMDCFAMGRSCACQSKYRWAEQWKWKDLLGRYEEWRKQIIEMDGGQTGKNPLPLDEERKLYPNKTLAQVCQEQLKVRPWKNVNGPSKDDEASDEEIIVNDDGTVKKTKKKPSKDTKPCHSCCHRHPKWMMAECSMCERGWCYGVLWRGYDLHPLSVMEDSRWECPHCQRICSVGACRKDPRQQPFEPKGTLLGHDTKKVADIRSVECLVDFSKANLNYLGETVDGSINNARMRLERLQAEANQPDQYSAEIGYVDEYDGQVHYEDDAIDPALGGVSAAAAPEWQANQTHFGDAAMENGFTHIEDIEQSQYPEGPLDNYNHHQNVAPEAVMVQPAAHEDEIQPVFSKKRKPEGDQIKLVSSKKRKKNAEEQEKAAPTNKANRQYLAAHENRRLEQARKEGRYIQVLAAIKKRSRIVKLSIDGEKLSQIIAQSNPPSRPLPTQTAGILLQSDIPAQKPTHSSDPKASKKVRVRIEDDRDFRERRQKKKRDKFEEIDVDELSDDEDITGGQRSQARRSEWLSRKHQDDEDLPDELPENFKDGSVNPRERERQRQRKERRESMPSMTKTPTIRPVKSRKSTGAVDGRKRGRPSNADIEARAAEIARRAIEDEENRKAKLLAAGIDADEAGDEDAEGSLDEEAPVQRETHVNGNGIGGPSNGATIIRKSIMNKGGPWGRKIKISEKGKKKAETVVIHDDQSSSDEEVLPARPATTAGATRKGPPGLRTLPGVVA